MLRAHSKKITFLLGPVLFVLILSLPIVTLSDAGQSVLACTAWVAFWWITESVELPVASILPIVIFPLSGALTIEQTTSAYGNPYIYLFMGGFIIGLTIEKWNLHKRIAFNIIRTIGSGEKRVLLGFMIATAFLSMWISNTATAIMMLPIGVSVAKHFGNKQPFSRNLLLGIGYAASIGGMATLIGTPPNIILAGIIKESMNIDISFLSWMLFATPFSIILLFLAWFTLSRFKQDKQAGNLDDQLKSLGKITIQEKKVLFVFIIVAFLWISRSFLLNRFLPGIDDTIIAVVGALAMFIIPAGQGKGNLMDWKSAKNLPWDVLLIFGAGLAIAKGFSNTDLTVWLAQQFSALDFLPAVLLIIIIIASINFLTEITSNTATASMVLPLLITLGLSLHLDTLPLLAGSALAASCAFMLPVATPPNAIVFSSGHIRIRDMVRAGFMLNLISIILIFLFIQFAWKWIF